MVLSFKFKDNELWNTRSLRQMLVKYILNGPIYQTQVEAKPPLLSA